MTDAEWRKRWSTSQEWLTGLLRPALPAVPTSTQTRRGGSVEHQPPLPSHLVDSFRHLHRERRACTCWMQARFSAALMGQRQPQHIR